MGTWQLPDNGLQELRMGKKEKENPLAAGLKGLLAGSQPCRRKPPMELPSLMRSLMGLWGPKKDTFVVSLTETKMHAITAHPVLRWTLTAQLGVCFLRDPMGRGQQHRGCFTLYYISYPAIIF